MKLHDNELTKELEQMVKSINRPSGVSGSHDTHCLGGVGIGMSHLLKESSLLRDVILSHQSIR